MEASSEYPNVTVGEGYAVGDLDALGSGPGFRKVRKGLGVTAFGVNAIVLPPGIETGFHYHDVQQELYFVHRGEIEMEFGDGSVHRLAAGGLARVDAATVRKIRENPSLTSLPVLAVTAYAMQGDREKVLASGFDGYLSKPIQSRVLFEELDRLLAKTGSGKNPAAKHAGAGTR